MFHSNTKFFKKNSKHNSLRRVTSKFCTALNAIGLLDSDEYWSIYDEMGGFVHRITGQPAYLEKKGLGTMLVALTSDTHYGHDKNTHRLHEVFLTLLAAEIKEKDIKFLIHAGDWTSSRQDQFYRTMKMFRQYINIPIVAVRGNHDLWQAKKNKYSHKMMHETLMTQHQEWFKEFNIHHLENGPFVLDDVIVLGYDGWYNLSNPPTNDADQMISNVQGVLTNTYLASQTYKKLDAILQHDLTPYRKAVMVTHHPPFTEDPYYYLPYCANPQYFQPIKDKFDVFCTGHSHHYWNEVQDDCLILNSGSDYNKPKHLIFEV